MRKYFSAPAKINLALRVVGKRQDGYHLLQTVMTFFPLFDRIAVEIRPDWEKIDLSCQPQVTPVPEENLAYRAAVALQRAAQIHQGAAIHLTKQIPHGGGLGGGSSDAATVLLALNKLWEVNWPVERLIHLGMDLGADIPFFLGGYTALAEGVGERLTFLPHLPAICLVLINPGLNSSTRDVFAALAGRWPRRDNALTTTDMTVDSLAAYMENDLEQVVRLMTPLIGQMKQALREVGATATLMSGSGSSVFGVFSRSEEAGKAAAILQQRQPYWEIIQGVTFNDHPFTREWTSGRLPC